MKPYLPRSFIWAQHQSAGCRGIKALIFDIVRVICISWELGKHLFSLMFTQTSSIVSTWHEHKLRFNVKSRPRYSITVYLNCSAFFKKNSDQLTKLGCINGYFMFCHVLCDHHVHSPAALTASQQFIYFLNAITTWLSNYMESHMKHLELLNDIITL